MLLPIQVLEAPDPIVLPEDIRGGTAGDTALEALIAAVTASIAAPTGWLGRSLGEQTLLRRQAGFDRGSISLPSGPVLGVESITYLDVNGDEQTLPSEVYRLVGDTVILKPGQDWPATACEPDAVRITYTAGYEAPPAQAKQAIILAVQHLRDLGATETFLRSETVEGIGAVSYGVSPAASEAMKRATESLLASLRLWR